MHPFEEGLIWPAASAFRLKPYSIRRGGATAFHRKRRSMELTLERGRWASVRVGRIYISDGLAKETEMQLPDVTQYNLAIKARALIAWFHQERGGGRCLHRSALKARLCETFRTDF